MAQVNGDEKFLNHAGLRYFWHQIQKQLDKKLESVTNDDDSIVVKKDRQIAVNISNKNDNALVNRQGLYVPKQKVLTLGEHVYDGTQDVNVAVYEGQYSISDN